MILLDGYSTYPTKTLQSVTDSSPNFKFFVVGYSNGVQPQEALAIAGGDASQVLLAATHEVLPLLADAVRMAACGELDFGRCLHIPLVIIQFMQFVLFIYVSICFIY
jgi:hypothetical protein